MTSPANAPAQWKRIPALTPALKRKYDKWRKDNPQNSHAVFAAEVKYAMKKMGMWK